MQCACARLRTMQKAGSDKILPLFDQYYQTKQRLGPALDGCVV
jgi:hypothetical protein